MGGMNPEDEVPCSKHPKAPHGFDRNSSHSLHRYVCDCEGWEPTSLRVLAIDPGTHESGFVLWDDGKVISAGVLPNEDMLAIVKDDRSDVLAIEGFVARGNVIDNNCVQTIRWEGRFVQAWGCPDDVVLISRREVKKCIGLPGSANDAKVNARLRELLGEKGTKANPGPTFGVTSHAWPALGVAYAASQR